MSCDEYIKIFNKLMNARSYTFKWFEKKVVQSFKNSYMSKRGGALSTLFSNPKKISSIQG